MDEDDPDYDHKKPSRGFNGFPKRLPDDCVEYIIHVINERLQSVSAIRNKLNEIVKAASHLKKQYLTDYIWQREAFELSMHPKIDLDKPGTTSITNDYRSRPHLRGRTDFGDSVADEWLIVFLLRELSNCFPDAWIRVHDTDGEFLLIEAAKSLPKWLNPEIAENRVWLNRGHIKIIALEGDRASHNLDLPVALSIIKRNPEKILVDSAIEGEAFYRIQGYPSAISSSFHHALLTVPRNLAYILRRYPTYISPAVESFYLRDPVSLKPLASKDLSTLYFAPDDFVTISVKFTKVGFAQLRSQLFEAPPAWTGIIPRVKDEQVAMGMKLTCGFEMLVADPHNHDKRIVREIKLLLQDIESGELKVPLDREIASWTKTQDDEQWLDIDYNDFEKELSGRAEAGNAGFGDQGAQNNLRKMVSRFQDFLDDDDAGAEGIDETDSNGASSENSDDENQPREAELQDEIEDSEFERAIKETRSMSESYIEETGLLEEARKLAMQDGQDASDLDEDQEMRKVMELMEKELKDHGALHLNSGVNSNSKGKVKSKAPTAEPNANATKPYFGPERPPHMRNSLAKKNIKFDIDEESKTGDGELSSDDEEFNDVDLGLAKNMLNSFKAQAGTAGPAGNLMKALGVGMPRDEDSD